MTTTSAQLLPATTSMGTVRLRVRDLDTVVRFYEEGAGLVRVGEDPASVRLGLPAAGDEPARVLVEITHAPDLPVRPSGSAGLFHTAILYSTPADLSAAVLRLARAGARFTGSSDHLVSEAFYFDDPEGNGVELYIDRPRDAWTWTDGQVQMATIFLDPNAYLDKHLDREHGVPVGATVGHVHLQVGDTATARDFYVDTLGFDATFEIPGQALFVSAGGYHHHMAMNVWGTRGAGLRAPALGLGRSVLEIGDATAVGEAAERLRAAGHQVDDDGAALEVDDPWGNRLRLVG
ncbi:VOC family protein [Georgenia sp. Z1491]|uniref:VOC family protein n=1 Tax=Georgenia sp. Z1491 TaxID=3416707 RepID=UPI003CF8F98B